MFSPPRDRLSACRYPAGSSAGAGDCPTRRSLRPLAEIARAWREPQPTSAARRGSKGRLQPRAKTELRVSCSCDFVFSSDHLLNTQKFGTYARRSHDFASDSGNHILARRLATAELRPQLYFDQPHRVKIFSLPGRVFFGSAKTQKRALAVFHRASEPVLRRTASAGATCAGCPPERAADREAQLATATRGARRLASNKSCYHKPDTRVFL
jgi:hypothetical protein